MSNALRRWVCSGLGGLWLFDSAESLLLHCVTEVVICLVLGPSQGLVRLWRMSAVEGKFRTW